MNDSSFQKISFELMEFDDQGASSFHQIDVTDFINKITNVNVKSILSNEQIQSMKLFKESNACKGYSDSIQYRMVKKTFGFLDKFYYQITIKSNLASDLDAFPGWRGICPSNFQNLIQSYLSLRFESQINTFLLYYRRKYQNGFKIIDIDLFSITFQFEIQEKFYLFKYSYCEFTNNLHFHKQSLLLAHFEQPLQHSAEFLSKTDLDILWKQQSQPQITFLNDFKLRFQIIERLHNRFLFLFKAKSILLSSKLQKKELFVHGLQNKFKLSFNQLHHIVLVYQAIKKQKKEIDEVETKLPINFSISIIHKYRQKNQILLEMCDEEEFFEKESEKITARFMKILNKFFRNSELERLQIDKNSHITVWKLILRFGNRIIFNGVDESNCENLIRQICWRIYELMAIFVHQLKIITSIDSIQENDIYKKGPLVAVRSSKNLAYQYYHRYTAQIVCCEEEVGGFSKFKIVFHYVGLTRKQLTLDRQISYVEVGDIQEVFIGAQFLQYSNYLLKKFDFETIFPLINNLAENLEAYCYPRSYEALVSKSFSLKRLELIEKVVEQFLKINQMQSNVCFLIKFYAFMQEDDINLKLKCPIRISFELLCLKEGKWYVWEQQGVYMLYLNQHQKIYLDDLYNDKINIIDIDKLHLKLNEIIQNCLQQNKK